jgi:hypothetical protein
MLSVAIFNLLSAVMLNVIMRSVAFFVMLSVVMLCASFSSLCVECCCHYAECSIFPFHAECPIDESCIFYCCTEYCIFQFFD